MYYRKNTHFPPLYNDVNVESYSIDCIVGS